ncbi:MAG TPA: hypothetical protein VFQ50_04135 [Flavobacterium sp.]|nr:hypothetical protein [Flavobacterium sp.]
MKKSEVPQDKSSLSSIAMRELCYATDDNGNYTTALSAGWEPKTVALDNSMSLINERIEEAKIALKKGDASPIAYYMELNRMDLTILSSYVGKWQWQVKRHFQPKVFHSLSEKTLSKYAEAFGITIEALKNPTI